MAVSIDGDPGAELPPRLTQREIAKHAGVSTATVSLVLRKSPLVADATRSRVLASAAALGYVYNRGAASLRTQQTHTVGVAINELVNPYFAELTAAIERALSEVGRTVFLSNSSEDPERQERFIATMREYNADGLILCPAEGTEPASLERIRRFRMPCVLVSRWVAGVELDYAGSDHRRGTALATEHLIGLGHRRIAMLGGNERVSTGIERRQGYRDALAARGLPIDASLVIPGAPTRENGAAWINQLLALPEPPTAAVCFNDVIAFGVMLGLRQLGREPGRDFAVIGNDDIAEAALWRPALTTVAVAYSAIGEAAARLLLERIAEPQRPAQRIVLEPALVVRDTAAPPRH
jgi:LacI family transcriptional regulator